MVVPSIEMHASGRYLRDAARNSLFFVQILVSFCPALHDLIPSHLSINLSACMILFVFSNTYLTFLNFYRSFGIMSTHALEFAPVKHIAILTNLFFLGWPQDFRHQRTLHQPYML
jgi:hypothetical protein